MGSAGALGSRRKERRCRPVVLPSRDIPRLPQKPEGRPWTTAQKQALDSDATVGLSLFNRALIRKNRYPPDLAEELLTSLGQIDQDDVVYNLAVGVWTPVHLPLP